MAQIVWIASYPKSGNTWVRFLVANLFYKGITSSFEMERVVPDIHKGVHAGHLYGDTTTFVTTRWKYHTRLPLREDTVAAIYILRHPLQVIVSNLNYLILRMGDTYFNATEKKKADIRRSYVEDFISHGGAAQWIKLGMGTWLENVGTWLDKGVPFPVLVTRYEDLKRDAADFVRTVCKSFRVEKSEEEIEAVVAASSFESLREMEEREVAQQRVGFFTSEGFKSSHARGRRFINEGKVDSYRELLTSEQVEAAEARFKPLMKQHGYMP